MSRELDAEYRAIIERLEAPCDCDCSPGRHWCFLCEPHGAFTREIIRAYRERVARVMARYSKAHGERSS